VTSSQSFASGFPPPPPRHHKNWANLKNCLAAEIGGSAEWKCAVGGMGAGGRVGAVWQNLTLSPEDSRAKRIY